MKSADEIRAEMAALEKELVKAEEAEAKAAQAGNAKRAIALLAAMRTAFREVQDMYPDTFDAEKWAIAFSPQAWPRTGKFRRIADLSETEIKNAQDAGIGAVAKL
jgi:hypothetical protein